MIFIFYICPSSLSQLSIYYELLLDNFYGYTYLLHISLLRWRNSTPLIVECFETSLKNSKSHEDSINRWELWHLKLQISILIKRDQISVFNMHSIEGSLNIHSAPHHRKLLSGVYYFILAKLLKGVLNLKFKWDHSYRSDYFIKTLNIIHSQIRWELFFSKHET